MSDIKPKTIDESWIDWESFAFGFGYGSGEPHTIPALKAFMAAIPVDGSYDYDALEAAVGPVVAWLFINRLCGHGIDMIEYGTSPRFGWLTERGKALQRYMASKTADELIELSCCPANNYVHCYPDACNHAPEGYRVGVKCANPFWT